MNKKHLYILTHVERGEHFPRYFQHEESANLAWIEAVIGACADWREELLPYEVDIAQLRDENDVNGYHINEVYDRLVETVEGATNDTFYIAYSIETFED